MEECFLILLVAGLLAVLSLAGRLDVFKTGYLFCGLCSKLLNEPCPDPKNNSNCVNKSLI